MDTFAQLAAAIEAQHRDGELPDFLVQPLRAIATSPERFSPQLATVVKLLHQVENFDAYAGAGCFGDSYGPEHILRTLMELTRSP